MISAGTEAPRRVTVIAALTAVGGVFAILAALRPFGPTVAGLNRLFNPVAISSAYRIGTQAASVAIGIALLYLAGNLARRKHVAWVVVTTLFAVHLVLQVIHLTTGGRPNPQATPVQFGFTAVMLVLLVWSRRAFGAKSDPPSLFQFVRFVPIYFGVVFVYGFAALHLEADHLSPAPTLVNDVWTILEGLIGVDGEYTISSRRVRLLFPNSLLVLGIIGLTVALVLILRPIVARPRTHADWDHANRLVHRYGSDTLAFFALRDDKSYFFSSDGEAMIAYTYIGRYALASGDPIGHADSIDLVIDEFIAMCRAHAWGIAFLAVRESESDRYLRRGLRTFYLGDEAVIDCGAFKLEGKKNKSMRQSVQRVARTHHFAMLHESEASPELIAQLNAISARWRGKAPERGFTMALSQEVRGENPEYELCVAYDEHDVPHGFLRVVPIVGDEPGATLDMMRRDPDAPNGMTEYLVASTVHALRDRGDRRLSMNFAVMARLFAEDVHFTRRQRVLKSLIALLNPFFQIKSLHDFNRRFRPVWQPRVIVYEDQRALPQVALLYSGVEGFLSVPVLGRYFVPRRFDREARAQHPSAPRADGRTDAEPVRPATGGSHDGSDHPRRP